MTENLPGPESITRALDSARQADHPPKWLLPDPLDDSKPNGDPGTDTAAGNGGGTESLEATVDWLASLPSLEYEQRREIEAAHLNVRPTALDREVKRHRKAAGNGGAANGAAVMFPEIEPWPESVNGAAVLKDLGTTFTRFLALPKGAAEAMGLWVLHAHAHDAAAMSPLLTFTSPEKRCGKTTALRLLAKLVPRPLPTSNVTVAPLFRAIEKWGPTLLIDEADSFMGDDATLLGVLNSGHCRDTAYLLRTVGDDYEPRVFRTWAAKAVARIGRLPGTLEDRSIVISMRRRRPDEQVERLRSDRDNGFADLTRQCARWAADNLDALRESDPEVPCELHDRAADNWRPLLSIADLAGEHWPKTARRAALELSRDDQDEGSYRVALLTDIRGVFEDRAADRLPSHTLCDALAAMEDRPWGEWRKGKPLTPHSLARILSPFKIAPKTVRVGTDTPKGYLRADFEDVFVRYLDGAPLQSATPQQVLETNGSGGNQTATQGGNVAVDNRPKAAEAIGCCGVAVGKGGAGEVRQWKVTL